MNFVGLLAGKVGSQLLRLKTTVPAEPCCIEAFLLAPEAELAKSWRAPCGKLFDCTFLTFSLCCNSVARRQDASSHACCFVFGSKKRLALPIPLKKPKVFAHVHCYRDEPEAVDNRAANLASWPDLHLGFDRRLHQ